MINNKTDLRYYIEQDEIANDKQSTTFYSLRLKNRFLKNLRKYEYAINRKSKNPFIKIVLLFRKWKHHVFQNKMHILIPPNCFGYGLRIEHPFCIVVNPHSKIGNNCNIHQFVTIGNNGKNNKCPTIGDNVYIGANSVIIGDIRVGNGVVVGANSTVTHSFDDCSVVCGSPAKIIKYVKEKL